MSAWVLTHKADNVYPGMRGAPSNEIKGEPQRGDGCAADAFMNARAELLLVFMYFNKHLLIFCLKVIIIRTTKKAISSSFLSVCYCTFYIKLSIILEIVYKCDSCTNGRQSNHDNAKGKGL